ncbi:hypothetical protein LRAMOSA07663 [Lichtheimia ramosa]|uniref:Cytochrome P450 n=1 Tax=Lichtheimia ramosa TaxID=688394 RepID=A0A077WDA5_9FUNG|nr:hypothetical protein LRAMOSA07663 [Lichtheimia ramosa]
MTIKHPWSLATAITLFTLYLGYKKLTTPPSSLAHLPRADFFAVIRALINETPSDQVAKTITLPAANKADHGLYVRFDNSGWTVRVTSPEAAKKLLLSHDLFPKARLQKKREGTIAGRLLVGPNILFETGEKWKEHRKIVNPAFHRSMPVALFGRLMQKLLHGELMTPTQALLNVHTITTRWTLDVIGLSSFDFDFHALDQIDNNPWVDRYHYLVAKAKNPLFFLFPILEQRYLFLFPDRQKVHNELSIFLGMMSDIISKKKQLLQEKGVNSNTIADNEKDLLALMIEAENDGEGRLSNDELLSNLCVFFLAGHDTTASALAYAIYYLAVNPDAQVKARNEALAVIGNDPTPSLDQMRSLSYINMVIKETLRLNPPAVSIIPRVATRDTELNGVFIPKGTRISLDIIDLQRNPAIWQDPDTFRPERFAPGGEAEQLTRNGMPWAPFSDGARKCIGSNFSMMEQRVFLTMLLREYEWSLPEDSIHKNGLITQGLGATQPKDLFIKFTKRG